MFRACGLAILTVTLAAVANAETVLFAVGENGTVLRTVDGGENWTPHQVGTTRELRAVDFIDSQTGGLRPYYIRSFGRR